MLTNRKKRIAALFTSATILSGMLLSAGTVVSAADTDVQNTLATFYTSYPSVSSIDGNNVIDNTSSLSSYSIYRGNSVNVRLSSQNGEGKVSYDVFYKKASSSKWSKVAENTTSKAIKLTPSVATDYVIRVDAKDSSGNFTRKELFLQVVEPLTNTSYLSSESISYGDRIKVFCRSEGGFGQVQYAVYYKRTSKTDWLCGKNYSTSDTVFIRPKVAATYEIKIKAKDEKGNISEKVLELRVKTASDLMNRTELSANSVTVGQKVMISNASTGGKGSVRFAAYYKPKSSEVWTRISNYTDAEIFSFKPAKTGEYIVRTKVSDSSGRIVNKDISLMVTKKVPEPVFTEGQIDDTEGSQPKIDNPIKTLNDYIRIQKEADPTYNRKETDVLPEKVDNSDNDYFPEIVDQKGSTCVSYSTTYYQYTYEYNRLHNIRTTPSNSFSPFYSYNMATDKHAGGMGLEYAYTQLRKAGAVTSDLVPFGKEVHVYYKENYTNYNIIPNPLKPDEIKNMLYYFEFPLKEEIYRSAADHRIRDFYRFQQLGHGDKIITSVDDPDIIPIKAALADGHVLSFTSYDNWRFMKLKKSDDPSVNVGVVNQNCIYYTFSQKGLHELTIVGYDDNIWTDINQDGKINSGEMGAFKIANSWGEDWSSGNKGYIWMAYDAINKDSCVEGFKLNADDDKNLGIGDQQYRFTCMLPVCGIQLMPVNYKSTLFMHYIANTNDRYFSYVNLTGEYNGKTVTECMNPYNQTEGALEHAYLDNTNTAIPYSYSMRYSDKYAHFVYDVSTIMRKLGATDYTKVDWTVQIECKGAADRYIKISDIYMCDEKNYRIYRPGGSTKITVKSGESRNLPILKMYSPYAVVNYRSTKDKVSINFYPERDDVLDYIDDVQMKNVNTEDGYTHTAMVELGDCDYYYVFFNDSVGAVDDNNGQNYRIFQGENYFEDIESIQPLKSIIKNYDIFGENEDDKIIKDNNTVVQYSTGKGLYIEAGAEGGVGPYRFRFSVQDKKTGAPLFDSEYGYKTNGMVEITDLKYVGESDYFCFDKAGDYKVTIYACDITGNTVTTSFIAAVREFKFSEVFAYIEGNNAFLKIKTMNDDISGSYEVVVKKDNNIIFQKTYYPVGEESPFDEAEADYKNRTITAKAKLNIDLQNIGEYNIYIRHQTNFGKIYEAETLLTVK